MNATHPAAHTTTLIPPPRPRRGRPPVAGSRGERLKHIKIAYQRLVVGESAAALADQYQVHRYTIYLWVDAALGYDDIEADGLRRTVAEQVGRN